MSEEKNSTGCLQHAFTDAVNYASGNVECSKCGALWLAWTPAREAAPELLAALEHAMDSMRPLYQSGRIPAEVWLEAAAALRKAGA